MPLIWVNQGERDVLGVVTTPAVMSHAIRLYKNDYVPNPDSLPPDFTQADFQGYPGGVALTFGIPATNAQGKAQTQSQLVTFTFTGGAAQTIYGYFIGNTDNTSLRCAERAPQPILLSVAGDTIKIQVTYTVESLF
jgi:hypothetical protein